VIQEYDDPTLYARGTHVPDSLENEELMLAVLSETTYVVFK
jgi:hypothetical protein